MNIHNILKVYKRDWKSIVINPVAAIIVAGVCILPSLYAWVNIKACWNTYENTSTIPVAVVNNDKEARFSDKKINIGREVIKKLKSNHKIGWKFVNSKEANMGLVDGTYYAMIEIPSDFSSSFLSVISDKQKKPQITYKVDTKANPVAGKITEVAKNTLVNQITTNFIATVNETIFSSLNNVGKDAENNKENIIKLKDSIITINNNMDSIGSSLKNLNNVSGSLSTFLGDISANMPKIDNSIDVIEKNNSNNMTIIKSAQNQLNTSINNIDFNLNSAEISNNKIQGLFKNLNASIAVGNSSKINSIIPAINVELDSLNKSIDVTVDYLTEYNKIDFSTDILKTINSLKELQTSLNNIKTQLTEIKDKLLNSSDTIDSIFTYLNTEVPKLTEKINNLTTNINSAVATLEDYNKNLNNSDLTQLISLLKTTEAALTDLSTTMNTSLTKLNDSKQSIKDTAVSLGKSIENIIIEIDNVNAKIDSATKFLQSVSDSLTNHKSEINNIITSLKKIQNPYIEDEKKQFNNILAQSNSINTISKNISDTINSDIQNINNQLASSVTEYNDKVKDDIYFIGNNLITATKDASDLITLAHGLSTQINNLISTAEDGSNLAAKFSGDLNSRLLEFKDVIKELSNKLQVVNNNDIIQIISILETNPRFIGDFMSNPFNLKDESINEIPNYGSSMAPIYSTLAIWVGCLILNSLFKAEVGYFDGIEKLTLREKHFGKMMIFSSLAMIQGLIIAIGDKYLLHVYTVSTSLMIVFAVVSSLVFSIITYTLVSTLGNVGKALAIIYMILQLAGSGGTYPIQVDPKIFRVLQPFFPFTYSVGGFREAIAGPLISSVALDFVALSLFAVAFLLFGFFGIEPLYKRVHQFEVKFKESGVGE